MKNPIFLPHRCEAVRWALPFLLLAMVTLPGCLGGSLGFGPDKVGPEDGWPDLTDATLRPGTRLYVPVDSGSSLQCTAGFLFQSADNATLYLSIAAHCLGEGSSRSGLGADVYRENAKGRLIAIGDVAFDGWAQGVDLSRDFALVAIRNLEGARDRTHPAMKHWGGPTGLADTSSLLPGTEVVTYAASTLRSADSPDNVKEGRFVVRDDKPLALGDGDQLLVRLEPPSQQGDSGSGLMLANGRAAGILSQGGQTVLPGTDFSLFVPLDEMVQLARAEGGPLGGLRLVTWPRLTTTVS